MSTTTIRVEVPRAFKPLLQPARYKGAHGGRAGAKSHFFAEQLVLRCYFQMTRWACIREVQNTIRESVRQLLIDKIQKLNLGNFFQVLDGEIRGANGSLIIFRGMQSYNAESIKSLEGYDGAWVEEAQTLSAVSLRMLRPTIRKPGSEIWFSWNPRHDSDAVDEFLRGANKPKDAIVQEVNWNDNPWFPEVLRAEKDRDYEADPEMAEHVWGGGYEMVSEGAYYAKMLVQAEREGRVGHFPYDPSRPIRTAWDLGVDDYTAIWLMQDDGRTATAIDYFEASGDGADQIISTFLPELFNPPPWDESYVNWSRQSAILELGRNYYERQVTRDKVEIVKTDRPLPTDRLVGYKYATHFLPHDIRMREWGHGARSRVESVVALGVKNISKGVAAKPADRVQAVRRILPIVRFNLTPGVQLGMKRLRRYHRKWNDSLQTYTTPEHDEASHGSDAFGEYAINCGISPPPPPKEPKKIDVSKPTLDQLVKSQFRHDNNGPGRI